MDEKNYLDLEGFLLYDSLIKNFINGKIFVGTYEEYKTAKDNGKVAIGALVILTDDETSDGGSSGGGNTSDSTSTSSLLGTGVLGYMILG